MEKRTKYMALFFCVVFLVVILFPAQLFGNPGSFAAVGSVIKRGPNDYIMYYTAGLTIGFKIAISTDGINWKKYSDIPCLTPGDFVSVDLISLPYVTKLGSTWYMVFEGNEAGTQDIWHIYMAKSLDGYNWRPVNGGYPIYTGTPRSWDSRDQANPSLYQYPDGEYIIVFNGQAEPDTYDIGIIKSNNLESGWTLWTKEPILTRGIESNWDDNRIEGARLIKDDFNTCIIRLWYFGLPTNHPIQDGKIGYASSTNILGNFIKNKNNPILVGTPDKWDGDGIRDPSLLLNPDGTIVKENNKFILYYNGKNNLQNKYVIGMAASYDGIYWVKYNNNPVFEDKAYYKEAKIEFIILMYNRFLDRSPAMDELSVWSTRIDSGVVNGAELVKNFVFSEECQSRISNYGNSEFIIFLYKALFSRVPENYESDIWLFRMSASMTREDVANCFTHSEEFINLCNEFNIIAYNN